MLSLSWEPEVLLQMEAPLWWCKHAVTGLRRMPCVRYIIVLPLFPCHWCGTDTCGIETMSWQHLRCVWEVGVWRLQGEEDAISRLQACWVSTVSQDVVVKGTIADLSSSSLAAFWG